jgi:hypothetical protein
LFHQDRVGDSKLPHERYLAVSNDNYEQKITVYERSWTGLLTQIRKRPSMYLGSVSLQSLHVFLAGFKMAEDMYAVPKQRRQEVDDFQWDAFETYVSDLYNKPRLSLNSFGLAQYEAQGKTIKTFDAFREYPGAWEIWWKWHDEFMKE